MFGSYFDHRLLQKYVVLFGTLFNNITIERDADDATKSVQKFKVPISYGPRQKIIARLKQNPSQKREKAIRLPRMSYEIVGFSYASDRTKNRVATKASNSTGQRIEHEVGWNINFQLNIMTATNADATKIVSQILPYFAPEWTIKAQILEDFPDRSINVPLSIDGVNIDDVYDGDFETRRVLIWTIDLTMHAVFFGPSSTPKVIKIAYVDFYTKDDMQRADGGSITVQPGLTANGEPTTDITETIPYLDIDEDDDYAYIVTVTDEPRQ